MKILNCIIPIIVLLVFFTSCSNKKDLGSGYFLDGDKILFRYQASGPSWPKVPWDNKYSAVNADAKTFTSLKWYGYAKDKQHYFYKGNLLTNIDYATFEITNPVKTGMGIIGIVKDKNHVYKFWNPEEIIDGANPKTFHITNYPKGNTNWFWYKDDKHYFVSDTMVSADVNTFKSIDEDTRFYIDKDNIYLLHDEYKKTYLEAIPAPDLLNQKIIYINRVVQTNSAIFYQTGKGKFLKIPIQDKSSVKYFSPDNVYMMIDGQVYCDGEKLDNVDVASFSVYQYPGSEKAKDGNYTSYAKDKNHVYYYDEILEDANPKTVRFVDDHIEDDTYKWEPEHGNAVIVIRKTLKKK